MELQDIRSWNYGFIERNETECAEYIVKKQEKALQQKEIGSYYVAASYFEEIVHGIEMLSTLSADYYEPPLYAALYELAKIEAFGKNSREAAIKHLTRACSFARACYNRSYSSAASNDLSVMQDFLDRLKNGETLDSLQEEYGRDFRKSASTVRPASRESSAPSPAADTKPTNAATKALCAVIVCVIMIFLVAHLFSDVKTEKTEMVAVDTVEFVTDYDYSGMSDEEIVEHGKAEAKRIMEFYCGKATKGSLTDEQITHEQIMELYRKADELVCLPLFTGWKTALGFDKSQPEYCKNGNMFGSWRCAETNRFTDFRDMCEQYFSCLSDDFVTNFFGQLAVINGRLYYYNSGDWGNQGVNQTIRYEILDHDGYYTLVVIAERYEDRDNPTMITDVMRYEFLCTYEDGAWVFAHVEWIQD